MKNSPDHNQFNELEKRLQEYTEQPDDLVWKNIDKALRPNRVPPWFTWVDGITSVTAIVLVSLLVSAGPSYNDAASPGLVLNSPGNESDSKRNESYSQRSQPDEPNETNSTTRVEQSDQYFSVQGANFSNINRNDKKVHPAEWKKNGEMNIVPDKAALLSNTSKESIDFDAGKDGTDSIFSPSLKVDVDSSRNKYSSPKALSRLPKRGFAFYMLVTPQLSFQRIMPVDDDGIVINKFYNQSVLAAERFGLSIDAGIQGRITKRLEYYGGISVYRQRLTLKYEYQSQDHISLESSGELDYVITPETSMGLVSYEMLNVGANAGVLYYLRGNKLTHKIGGGLSYQHGLKKSSGELYDNSESNYLFYQVFYRNEARLSARLKLFVQPTFSHSIYTNEKLDAPFNLKPYRAGLGFGILYDF